MNSGAQSPIDQLRAQVSAMLDAFPAGNPISAIVLFEVNQARETAFLQIADALTTATRKLPGCNVFSFHKAVKANPTLQQIEYLIYEDWQTRDFFRTQWDSDHLKQFQNAVGDSIGAPPDLRFYHGWREYRFHTAAKESSAFSGKPQSMFERGYSALLSLPISVSLLGLEQMARVLDPPSRRDADDVGAGANAGSRQEMPNPFQLAFQLGNAMTRAALDTTQSIFRARGGDSVAPANVTDPGVTREEVHGASAAGWDVSSQPAPSWSPSAVPGQPSVPESIPGWGPMPYSVPSQGPGSTNSTGGPQGSASGFAPIAEPDISPSYPFCGHFVNVLGSKMHYIDEGSGKTILLLHGNPSWSYIWRNIIPHLSRLGRCIAPDLIGYGRSGKPDIDYQWSDHVRYLEAFIEALDLHDVTLVLHDQGSSIGFHYAMYHQENIRGIAFFEAIVRPYPWDHFSSPEFREIFRKFRTGGVGGEGWQMIVEQNVFIEQLLPQAAGRPLSKLEMQYYREPFLEKHSRIPIWRFPRQTPIGGEPRDVWDAVAEYSRRLCMSRIPKFMLYASPGALLTQEHVQWCQQNINKLQSVHIGPGIHFLQESSPTRIGKEIAAWYQTLD